MLESNWGWLDGGLGGFRLDTDARWQCFDERVPGKRGDRLPRRAVSPCTTILTLLYHSRGLPPQQPSQPSTPSTWQQLLTRPVEACEHARGPVYEPLVTYTARPSLAPTGRMVGLPGLENPDGPHVKSWPPRRPHAEVCMKQRPCCAEAPTGGVRLTCI